MDKTHDTLEMPARARAFIGVACRQHVLRGVSGGFAQVCHGRRSPLAAMRPDDWLIYYSPGEVMGGPADVKAFTAIGRVADRSPYAVPPDARGFAPARRDVVYLPARSASLASLLPRLAFARGKVAWGLLMRRGHFPIEATDLAIIAAAMGLPL